MEITVKSKPVHRLADIMSPDHGAPAELRSPYRPSGLMQALIRSSVENLQGTRPCILAFADQAGPSRAQKVLEFATSGTANCSGGRRCARLYLALQGMAVPVGDTAIDMDPTRLDGGFRRWVSMPRGAEEATSEAYAVIAAAQPLIWERAQALSLVWEKEAVSSR
jgi:hypothetical protein